MDRINHASAVDIGGGRRGFRSKDTVAGLPGTVVTATHLNATQEETMAVIEKAGLAPDAGDLAQLLRAIRSQRLNFVAAAGVGGTANAVTLAFEPTFLTLADLVGVPLVSIAEADNTGAMTVKVDALAVTARTWPDGSPLVIGDVKAGALIIERYDGTAFRMHQCLSPTQVRAISPQTNLLINGDFQLNQRAFAGGALANNVYGYDRWKASGASNMAVAGLTLALTSGEVHQIVEPAFWGFANLASTMMAVSVDAPSHDLAVTLGSANGVITAGAGRRSVILTTGAGDTGNLSLKIARSGGGACSFGRVKLEIGAAASPWQARTSWQETLLCYRYFWRWVAPYLDARIADAGSLQDSGLFTINLPLPVEMRTTPTVTWANLSRKVSSNSPLLTLSSFALHKHSLALAFTSAALSPGVIYPASLVSAAAGAHLTLDSEF